MLSACSLPSSWNIEHLQYIAFALITLCSSFLSLHYVKALIYKVHKDVKAWTSEIKSCPYPPHKATGDTSPWPWCWGPHIHSYPRPHTARWWGVAEHHSCLPHSWVADLHPVSSSGCVVEGWEAHKQPPSAHWPACCFYWTFRLVES